MKSFLESFFESVIFVLLNFPLRLFKVCISFVYIIPISVGFSAYLIGKKGKEELFL